MRSRTICLSICMVLGSLLLGAQVSPNCDTAIPICNSTPVNAGTQGYGADDFHGAFSTGCLEQTLTGAIESNSAWYRFRTAASGQLGFNIGFETTEDWDFALYRATDCGNLGDPVRCNFFDNQEEEASMGVGEDPSGNTGSVLYEDWLQVQPGEDYYLLINNFTNNNSGFSIQFTGGIFVTNPTDALDCSLITNLLGPPIAACTNQNIQLDASNTPEAAISYAWFLDTGTGFQPIPGETTAFLTVLTSATYRVEVTTTTGNSISDVQVGFTQAPVTALVQDEYVCSDTLAFDLSQKDQEALGTQNADEVLVSYHSNMADAQRGAGPFPKTYPLSAGSETIYIRTTSVQNSMCYDVSEEFILTVEETPILDFQTEVFLCDESSGIIIGDSSPDPQLVYSWDSGENTPSIVVSAGGTYTLTATNYQQGQLSCTATATITVIVSESPTISGIIIGDLQRNNSVEVVTAGEGEYEFQLDAGPFQNSGIFSNVAPGMHTVAVNDPKGCGMLTETITVVGFPKFFTPNGDGVNDLWHVIGVTTLRDAVVRVYDRYGKLLKQMEADFPGWDGTYNGQLLPSSDYWFKLSYTDNMGLVVEAKYIQNHFVLKR